jgi:hypothetical protein
MFADLGFIEMLEHGHRIMRAIDATRGIALEVPPEDYEPLTPRDDFDAAYERTREMQVVLIAFMEGPRVLRDSLGHEPTSAGLLDYVADEVEAKSPRTDD